MLHHLLIGYGRPLLILHGSTLDQRHMMESLEPVFDALVGRKRIYVDMPGHGKSPPQEGIKTNIDLLAAVLSFVNAFLPDDRFGIVAESWGSYIARGM